MQPILITVLYLIRLEGHQQFRKEVESQSRAHQCDWNQELSDSELTHYPILQLSLYQYY